MTSKWVPRGTQNRSKIDKNKNLGSKVSRWASPVTLDQQTGIKMMTPDPKKEPPGLQNARIEGPICIKHGPHISLDFNPLEEVWASQMPVNQSLQTGGPAAGGEALGYTPRQALACRRRREQTSAQGPNRSRRELWGMRPVPPRQGRAFKNHDFFDMLKKSLKSHKIASQGEPKWSQKSKKSQKNAFPVPLEKQTEKKKQKLLES